MRRTVARDARTSRMGPDVRGRSVCLALVCVLALGCRVSPRQARELAAVETQPERLEAAEYLRAQLDDPELGVPAAAWALDSLARLAVEGSFALHAPTAYGRVRAVLEAWTQPPRPALSPDQRQYLQAWAVRCLGLLEDPDTVGFLVEQVGRQREVPDGELRLARAALVALVPLEKTLRAAPQALQDQLCAALFALRRQERSPRGAEARELALLTRRFLVEILDSDVLADALTNDARSGSAPATDVALRLDFAG